MDETAVLFFGIATIIAGVGWGLIARDLKRHRPIDGGLLTIISTVTGLALVMLIILLI